MDLTGCGKRARGARARALAIALIAVGVPLQFAVFYRDYFTHYKLRSAFYYDPAAFADVAAYLMADEQAPLIYLSVETRRCGRKMAVLHDARRPPGADGKNAFVLNDGLDIGPGDAGSLLAVHTKTEQLGRPSSRAGCGR